MVGELYAKKYIEWIIEWISKGFFTWQLGRRLSLLAGCQDL